MRDDRDPYPWSWEIPVAGVVIFATVLLLGLQVGRGLACLLAGQGWQWPRRSELITTAPGLVSGDAGAGLSASVAIPTAQLTITIVVVELLTVIMLGYAARELLLRWGPNVPRGMATGLEAERLLGLYRLRRARRIVRPDLSPSARSTPTEGEM